MNKVKLGLKNLHYAKIESYDQEAKKYTYGEVKKHPGIVEIALDPQGNTVKKYADDGVYYTSVTNMGYEGDIDVVDLEEEFLRLILGEEEINGVLVEKSDVEGSEFAMMFEITDDATGRRYIFWRCKAARASVNGKTKEDSAEPQDDKITVTVMPRENDSMVKGCIRIPRDEKASDYESKKETFDSWFDKVWEPTTSPAPENRGAETQSATKSSKQENSLL